MSLKSILKPLNNIISCAVAIAVISVAIFHFFVHKIHLDKSGFIILWSCMALLSLSNVIDAKFFQDDSSVKVQKKDIFVLCIYSIFIMIEIIL
ncbi:hypothetical protein [Inediibacterium massiliense]|uniref:hypothetical protein n=1 Tax=Inediibacterium massiliense TaxID=1658111 RepID=UPI0006B5B65C|nr:hypothetical protein [Inediibacterium massiliense]